MKNGKTMVITGILAMALLQPMMAQAQPGAKPSQDLASQGDNLDSRIAALETAVASNDHEDERAFVKLDLSSIFNTTPATLGPGLAAFANQLPAGPVTFSSNIDFDFPKTDLVAVLDRSSIVMTGLHVEDTKAVHFLINSFNTFLSSATPGDEIGKITLSFENGYTEVTALVEGVNIREWRQLGDCGATINTITDPRATVEFMGTAPNVCTSGSGLAVIDRLTVPAEYGDTVIGISVTDTQSGGPSIFFWAITVEVGSD